MWFVPLGLEQHGQSDGGQQEKSASESTATGGAAGIPLLHGV